MNIEMSCRFEYRSYFRFVRVANYAEFFHGFRKICKTRISGYRKIVRKTVIKLEMRVPTSHSKCTLPALGQTFLSPTSNSSGTTGTRTFVSGGSNVQQSFGDFLFDRSLLRSESLGAGQSQKLTLTQLTSLTQIAQRTNFSWPEC